MKIIEAIFASLILISCGNDQMNAGISPTIKYNSEAVVDRTDSNRIQLIDKLSINWSPVDNDVRQDSLFTHIKANIQENREVLTGLISDTTLSIISACKRGGLHKGDIAFMILDKIYHIPYFKVFGVQFDVIDAGCHYPVGLFDYLEANRGAAMERVTSYLAKSM
jgi:hypothetical protein